MSSKDPGFSFLQRVSRGIHLDRRQGDAGGHVDKRSIISSVFLSMLLGLAYAEMFPAVRDSVRTNGLSGGTILLGLVFFFVSMRFFIGNQLHLLSPSTLHLRGDLWIFDFLVITFETTLICFLGGLTAVEINRTVPIDFLTLLLIIHATDVLWIAAQKFLGSVAPRWRREFIPRAWAGLNAILLGCLWLIPAVVTDVYGTAGLSIMLALNVAGFAADVFLIDHYDML